ncbi:hypothetical protein J1N35_015392 [Gossypium stocksii]|uniref:MULE transposase domain-containing protein n=1 Tax=Gossypium stocksii TaxID=47602 RepID=A0A9D3VXT4_9ROSI|nr:hypothetical protein J1N35_015392 [Gossypium stocksii]
MKAFVFGGSMKNITPARHSPVPSEPEDVEGGSDEEEEDPRFRAYSPPAYIHNVDISTDDTLEFPYLPHRTRDCTGSSLDSGELEVGKEFPSKDSFLGALKQHSINHGVNYNVVKSKSEKFEAKFAVQDEGVGKDASGWDDSYNEVWQWCQVQERYVPSCITDLETVPVYYNDRLLRGCQVFKRLFWSFKQYRDPFVCCKLLIQIDGTFMYGRYTHRLLLAVAQDGVERIFPIAFAITPGELVDDLDFVLSRFRRHVCPNLIFALYQIGALEY